MRSIDDEVEKVDIAVVGGGLAGLAAAAVAAKGGRSVMLFERSKRAGGRAGTSDESGYKLNIGPHAVYRKGPGLRLLRELGVEPTGRVPGTSGTRLVRGGRAHAFPSGPLSLLTTGALTPGERLEAPLAVASLLRARPAELAHVPAREWIERTARREGTRDLLAALFRVSSYTADVERLSAGAAVAQAQAAIAGGVLYADGGWQTIVDALRGVAERHGARVVTGARVERVEWEGGATALSLAGGGRVRASAAILAVGPKEAAALVAGTPGPLEAWAARAVPVRAACLDLALERCPRPRDWFALGLDRPLYFSVHTNWAKLAPEGGAVAHAMMYLPTGHDAAPAEVRGELEALADLMLPGWRERVVAARFLPEMTVSNAIASVETLGTDARPGPEVPGMPGLYVAGDWVGAEGMLADASLASARRAAEAALAALARSPRAGAGRRDGAGPREVREPALASA